MGLLFDLGVSSPQLDDPERGFAYAQDAPLDMRMDRSQDRTAADMVNGYPAAELARVLRDYGEERFARRIAEAVVRERARGPITSTQRLSAIVKDAIPAATRRTGGNPAKRTFQALRIEVNDELGTLRRALPAALDLLAVGGRVVVLAYHSLEDRIVKRELVRLPPTDAARPAGARRTRLRRSSACSPGAPSAPTAKKSPAIRARPPPGCGPRSGSGKRMTQGAQTWPQTRCRAPPAPPGRARPGHPGGPRHVSGPRHAAGPRSTSRPGPPARTRRPGGRAERPSPAAIQPSPAAGRPSPAAAGLAPMARTPPAASTHAPAAVTDLLPPRTPGPHCPEDPLAARAPKDPKPAKNPKPPKALRPAKPPGPRPAPHPPDHRARPRPLPGAPRHPRRARSAAAAGLRKRPRHRDAPFILLLVGLLGGALVSLLVISTTLAQGAFRITNLQEQNANLARQEQTLSNEVAQAGNPAVIAQQARAARHAAEPLPGFIDLKTGKIVTGKPTRRGGDQRPRVQPVTPQDPTRRPQTSRSDSARPVGLPRAHPVRGTTRPGTTGGRRPGRTRGPAGARWAIRSDRREVSAGSRPRPVRP